MLYFDLMKDCCFVSEGMDGGNRRNRGAVQVTRARNRILDTEVKAQEEKYVSGLSPCMRLMRLGGYRLFAQFFGSS